MGGIQMDLEFNIDSIKIFNLKEKKHIVINGWCIQKDTAKIPDIIVKIDDEKVETNLIRIRRQDIVDLFKLGKDVARNGFKIVYDTNSDFQKLEIDAVLGCQSKKLEELTGIELKKHTINSSIEYYLDNAELDRAAGRETLTGWAISYDDNEIKYQIINSKNQSIDFDFRVVKRDDLVSNSIIDEKDANCGFSITFNAKTNERYFLIIYTDESNVKINVDLVSNTVLGRIKRFLNVFSPQTINRAFDYFKRNGFKAFVKRLGKGAVITSYDTWFKQHRVTDEELSLQKKYKFDYSPKISIVVPTFNTPIEFLHEMIDSVRNQSYSNWELCIADGSTKGNPAIDVIKKYAKKDSRIKVTFLDKNYGISGNTNKALELATGEYTGLFDHDDLLEPNLLFEIVKSLQENRHDIVYTDEDKLNNSTGLFIDPNFKPDYSPDLFLSHNYITHFFTVKTSIIKEIGGFRDEYNGSQDYDLMFRCIEKSKSIYHIAKPLYHWRMHFASTAENPESKMYCYVAGQKAIQDHLDRIGVKAKVEMIPEFWGMYHTKYSIDEKILVSIIITNVKKETWLEKTLESLSKEQYQNLEVIIAGKVKQTFINKYKKLNIKVISSSESTVKDKNICAKNAKGSYLFFMNGSIKLLGNDTINEMLGIALRKEVGCVSGKISRKNKVLKHAGIILGYDNFYKNAFINESDETFGYMLRPRINCNYSAVTGDMMIVSASIFNEVGGYDESFVSTCADVDFCIKVRKQGYYNVYCAFAKAYDYTVSNKINSGDRKYFLKKNQSLIESGDPFYNANFLLSNREFAYV